MTTPPPPCYLTAEHSICTAGGILLTMHADPATAETVLELGALGYLYECHLLVDSASPGPELIVYPSPAERISALETEVARLTAALAEAEQRAAGPFFGTCDGLDDAEYGRRLEDVLDRLCERLGESLEEEYEPEEWPAVVAGWEMTVGHGVELVPVLDDDGGPRMGLRAAAGWWYYDLHLTVTPNGQPVLTATRRAGGAR